MKRSFYFLFLFAYSLIYSQSPEQEFDYFVQFNGNQLSKKISVTELINHSLIKSFTEKSPVYNLEQYDALFKLDQKISLHGNFKDSLAYYQITIPIKNREAIKNFILEKSVPKDSLGFEDSPLIEDFEKYSLFVSTEKNTSVAWNDDYLIIFKYTGSYNYPDYTRETTNQETIEIDEEIPTEEPETETVEIPEEQQQNETEEEDPVISSYDYYLDQKTVFESLQLEQQNEHIKTLFENGFVAPHSDKINAKADVSSWINYSSAVSSMSNLYGKALMKSFSSYLPTEKNFDNFIKGINLNFYFNNDHVRVEETIEYNKTVVEIMKKVTTRKINNSIFNYFPNEKPLAYMSYHINTAELLKNIPSLTTDMLSITAFKGEDLTIVSDLINTIIDEEETAKLMDGDISLFLYDVIEKEITTKSYNYDENYERIEVENTTKKSIPLFSVVLTSTHKTIGDKLIQLGLRKGFLLANENYYEIEGTEKFGGLYIIKDQDVVVISNSKNHFKNSSNSAFAKELKKELKQNYFVGNINIEKIGALYNKQKESESSETLKIKKFSEQFKEARIQSSKKLQDNKLKIDFILKTSKSDKNIILQTLDLMSEIK